MAAIRFLVDSETKSKILRLARERGRSVRVEVTIALLNRYRPKGWEAMIGEVKDASRPSNGPRARVRNGSGPEQIFIEPPDALKGKLQEEAGKHFRSVSAEIRRFLVEEYR